MVAGEQELRERFCDAEQGHVFRFWDELGPDERSTLVAQLKAIDLDKLNRLINQYLAEQQAAGPPEILPAQVIPRATTAEQKEAGWRAREVGEEALRAGRVAILVVAGGQATRLGYDGPKGTFPVTPITAKSLFQVHAEKTLALQRRYGAALPFLVLVSPHNRADTQDFFEKHAFFGLSPEEVHFIEQGMLPAVDRDGRLLLAERGRIFLSPDGHGGVFSALARSGLLDSLAEREVDTLFYFQVDNPLVKLADPVYVGYHLEADADLSLKVVRKRDEAEKVGIYTLLDGRPGVLEYSDLPEEIRSARDEGGDLKFWAGNIAIHLFKVDFVRRVASGEIELPFHMARKKVPHVNDRGELVHPTETNGLKFESFVFDSLPFAERAVALEVDRAEEFAPVKNRTGEDSPESCKEGQSRLFRSWLRDAGIQTAERHMVVEIGPLFALDREELARKLQSGGLEGAQTVLFA